MILSVCCRFSSFSTFLSVYLLRFCRLFFLLSLYFSILGCFVSGLQRDGPVERRDIPAAHGLPAVGRRHGVSAVGAEGLPVSPRQPSTAGRVPEVPHPNGEEGTGDSNTFIHSYINAMFPLGRLFS